MSTNLRPSRDNSSSSRLLSTLWWLALIAAMLAFIGLLAYSIYSNSAVAAAGIVITPIDSYSANIIQLTRCADATNSCGRFSLNQPTAVPTEVPNTGASNSNSNENIVQNPNAANAAANPNTGGGLAPATANPDIETVLDSIFVPNPVPALVDGLSSEDRLFFDRANNATFEASSLRYDVDINLLLTTPSETGAVGLHLEGILASFFDGDENFDFSVIITPRSDVAGIAAGQSTELRIIADTLYIQSTSPDGQAVWFSTSFAELSALSLADAGGAAFQDTLDVNLSQLDQVPQFLELFAFGSFVRSERATNQGDEAVFNTNFDIKAFLKSELLESLILSISGFSGANLNDPAIIEPLRMQTRAFQAQVDGLLPRFDFVITRHVSLSNNYLTKIFLDLDTTVAIPDETGAVSQITVAGDVAINLSGFDQNLQVEAPTNAIPITAEQIQQLQAQMP